MKFTLTIALMGSLALVEGALVPYAQCKLPYSFCKVSN